MVQISSRSSRTRECHPVTLCHVTCCEESWHRVMCHDRHVRSHRVSLPPVNCFGKRAMKKWWWNFQHYTCQWLSSCLVGCKTSLFLPQCKRWRRTITDEVSASFYADSRVWECETIITRSQSPPPVSAAVAALTPGSHYFQDLRSPPPPNWVSPPSPTVTTSSHQTVQCLLVWGVSDQTVQCYVVWRLLKQHYAVWWPEATQHRIVGATPSPWATRIYTTPDKMKTSPGHWGQHPTTNTYF